MDKKSKFRTKIATPSDSLFFTGAGCKAQIDPEDLEYRGGNLPEFFTKPMTLRREWYLCTQEIVTTSIVIVKKYEVLLRILKVKTYL